MDPEPGRCIEQTVKNGGVRAMLGPLTSTGGFRPYASVAGGTGVSAFIDQFHLNQRIPESSNIDKGAYGSSLGEISENDTKPSSGRILRPFFNDWPRTVEEQEVLATSLSISVPGDTPSDFSLKLSTGNNDGGHRGEEVNVNRERGPLNWGMMWGTHHAGSMGGPLAEALRSSSVSNS
ncbi:growth-regulating factor 3-like [Bidens hawaiensis]|uniref:growth-regulating factor 3-like n=1 Tax=Bidens hawaiensis TaxID=980011 RepID=UPI004049A397